MLAMILLFLVTAAWSFAAVVFFNRRYEEALPLSVFLTILLQYVFGLAGLMRVGVYGILVMSLGAACAAFIRALRQHKLKDAFLRMVTPGFCLFFVLTLFAIFSNAGRLVIEYDEYSHWALAVKAMARYDVFAAAAPAAIPFATYPPAMTLLQYFATVLNGAFSEGLLYMCYQFAGFALLLPILRNTSFRQVGKNLMLSLCILLVPMMFKANLYGSILTDCFMGLTAGYAFALILLGRKKDAFYRVSLCAALCILTLTKDTGVFFAVMVAVAAIIDTLCFSDAAKKTRILSVGCICAAPLAAKLCSH